MSSTVEQRLREHLITNPGDVIAAYLFGSHARGTAGPQSDVDIAILLPEAPPRTLLGQPFALEDDLREMLGIEVQLVILNTAPADLIHRVLRDSSLMLDRDPGARIRFEVSARNAYFDLKPFLDRYRRAS